MWYINEQMEKEKEKTNELKQNKPLNYKTKLVVIRREGKTGG